jgi:hypothetical protein
MPRRQYARPTIYEGLVAEAQEALEEPQWTPTCVPDPKLPGFDATAVVERGYSDDIDYAAKQDDVYADALGWDHKFLPQIHGTITGRIIGTGPSFEEVERSFLKDPRLVEVGRIQDSILMDIVPAEEVTSVIPRVDDDPASAVRPQL